MAYIGNNPKLKSIVSSGDSLANLTAEPRKAGRFVYATDVQQFFYDNGTELQPVGNCPNDVDTLANLTALAREEGNIYYATDTDRLYADNGSALVEVGKGFDAVDTKANLDALTREQGRLYYATDEDVIYSDDGTQLNGVGTGGSGIPSLNKGGLITSDGTSEGELAVGADGQFLSANSLAADNTGLEWAAILQVPSGGTTGQVLTKTAGGYAWQAAPSGGMSISAAVNTQISAGQSYTVPANTIYEGNVSGNGGLAYLSFAGQINGYLRIERLENNTGAPVMRGGAGNSWSLLNGGFPVRFFGYLLQN